MSKEKINIALGILIIAGVAVNVYQFIGNNSLRSELYTLEAEIETLQNESTTLDTELSSGKENISNFSSQLEELETAIDYLEANNKSLSENLEELKATKEVQEETGTDSGLSDIDMDALIDQMVQQTLDEHPEWTANNGTGTAPYEGPHVGTPDTGEFINPNYTVGESGNSGIAPGIIY